MPATSPPDSLLHAYTERARVRVCGLLVHQGALLLTAHRGLLPDEQAFWSPPGGGWHFGETLREGVAREFREETGLEVRVGRFLHLHEYHGDNLQAVELFFEVVALDPAALPRLGHDPEHAPDRQLLTALAWRSPQELVRLPPQQVHPILRDLISTDDAYIPQLRLR
ncbi:NUDIX domain-containing protein [Hymenobacter sp. 15J16-1T3B]|uniref:NUDIX domain-containing protein n=1 Tax=Hymenobacter sp. 15J16-1T3B TaxID=2886941 RepID=UPI001D1066E2|nr:NUDIX domain-containing protein [Hymenobacter sp. 15J16-1T3B]MCC3159583.1 NUDIX domain-containing protein [Hymenobacter sp. 15J16-1T3B]